MLNERKEKYEKEKMINSISFENSNEEKLEEYMDARLKYCLVYVFYILGITGKFKIVRVFYVCIVLNI